MYIRKKSEGYTLIELIISMVLIGIVSVLLVYILASIMDILQENRIRKQLLMDGYNATAKFVREFELVENESDLLIGNSDEIQFITNIDGIYYSITYEFVGSEIQRTFGGGSTATLSTNANGQFEYYTKDHIAITAPLTLAQLRTVRRVKLILNMLNNSGVIEYIYTADAFPENYRFSGGGS